MLPLNSTKGVGYEKVASQCCDDDTYNGPEDDVIATVAAAPARTSAAAHHHHHQNNLLQRAIAALWAHGGACVVLSALISATSVMLVKLLGSHVPVFEVTLVRGLLSFAATLMVARARKISHVFGHKEHLALLVTRGLTGSVAMVLYYLSILLLPLADAASVFFTQPALTAVLARLMLGEPLGFKGAAGAIASFAGLLVLLHPPGLFGGGGHAAWGPKRVLGVASGALSAWVSAAAFITVRVIGKREAALTVAMHFHTFTIALSALPLLLSWPAPAVAPTLREAALLVAIAATSFVALLLLTRGLQLYGAARVAAINFSQVVYSYAFGILIWHDALTWTGAAGSLLIAAGIAMSTSRHGGGGGSGGGSGGDGSSGGEEGDGDGGAYAVIDLSKTTAAKLSAAARDAAGAGVGSITALGALAAARGAGGGGGAREAAAGRAQEQQLVRLAALRAAAAAAAGSDDGSGSTSEGAYTTPPSPPSPSQAAAVAVAAAWCEPEPARA